MRKPVRHRVLQWVDHAAGLWFGVYGSWFVFYGLWFMVYGFGFSQLRTAKFTTPISSIATPHTECTPQTHRCSTGSATRLSCSCRSSQCASHSPPPSPNINPMHTLPCNSSIPITLDVFECLHTIYLPNACCISSPIALLVAQWGMTSRLGLVYISVDFGCC